MPLGTEVGLGPGHIVLDEDPAPAHVFRIAAKYRNRHRYFTATEPSIADLLIHSRDGET